MPKTLRNVDANNAAKFRGSLATIFYSFEPFFKDDYAQTHALTKQTFSCPPKIETGFSAPKL